MKAILFHEFGSPEVLHEIDVADPEPGEDEIVIAVSAVSVNRTLDCELRAGRYAYRPVLPHVLGVDPAGEVVAVGTSVTSATVGDRVATRPVVGHDSSGAPQLLGVHRWGGYAKYVCVPATNAVTIPDGLPYASACIGARHFPLAFAQLRDHGRVGEGDWVLVMGAAGGLGSAGVQVGRHLGARVIAAAGAPERVQAALEQGADAGVDYRSAGLVDEVMRITGGQGVQVVIENIGDPDLFPLALASLARGGRLVTAGAHGGGIVPLDVSRLYQRELTIIGAPQDSAQDYVASLDAIANGGMRPSPHEVLPMARAAEAHRRVESGKALGKIVLDPS